jgi:hypothetical protein
VNKLSLEKSQTRSSEDKVLHGVQANRKKTATFREDKYSRKLKSEETSLVESKLNRMTRKIISSPSQTDVNIPELHYTNVESLKQADKLREIEDKILEMQKCITELRIELYSERLKVKENIQTETVPLVRRTV